MLAEWVQFPTGDSCYSEVGGLSEQVCKEAILNFLSENSFERKTICNASIFWFSYRQYANSVVIIANHDRPTSEFSILFLLKNTLLFWVQID